MIKRIPYRLNIITKLNKRCYVYLPIPYNWRSLSRDHQIVTMMNHCCYGFDGHIAFNALAKLQKPLGGISPSSFNGQLTARLVVICLGPISPPNGLLSVRSRWCAGHIRFCGHESGAWWEESWNEIHPGYRTQKYSKDEKETGCSYHVTYAL